MSTISRQETAIRLVHAFYNGGFRTFDNGTGADFNVYNADFKAIPIFEGSAVTTSVNKFEFSNFLGYRLQANFTLELPEDPSSVYRNFFDVFGSMVNRTVETGTANGAGAAVTALVINSGVSAVNDWFNGVLVSGLTGGDVVITDYVGGTLTATLASARTWSNGAALTFKIQPNFKTLVGMATDNDSANLIYYNISDVSYGITREFTINKNIISLSLSSVELQNTIPDSFTVIA
jgi:hypothetical protein